MLRVAILLSVGLASAGCLQVDERWVFDDRGGGGVELVIDHDAALLAQVRATIGERALATLGAREVPLTIDAWRDLLADAEGVEVLALEEGAIEDGGGRRRFRLALRFEGIEHLARIEPFAARPWRLVGPDAGATGNARRARLEVHPFRRIPLIDPWLALRAGAKGADAASRDEPDARGILARLGIERDRAERLDAILAVRAREIRLACEVEVPGRLLEVAGERADSGTTARSDFDIAALADANRDRALRIAWRVGELDRVIPFESPGDDPRPRLSSTDAGREP